MGSRSRTRTKKGDRPLEAAPDQLRVSLWRQVALDLYHLTERFRTGRMVCPGCGRKLHLSKDRTHLLAPHTAALRDPRERPADVQRYWREAKRKQRAKARDDARSRPQSTPDQD